MTAAAIARLAGVGRAAVSNWRRRYPGFPKPVGGSDASPMFARADVEAWLTATGKADQLATAGRTATGTQHKDGEFDQSPFAQQLASERGLADLTPAQLLAKVMAALLPRSIAADRGPDDPELDADTDDVPVILDPACFNATALLAVADRFADRVKLVGQDINETATSMAAFRLRHNPYGTPYEIQVGDSFLDNRLIGYRNAAAAVVCEPPYDPSPWPADELATDPRWEFGTPSARDGELAWVQHCYAHLRPRGVAVVAVSPRTNIHSSGQQIRAALVRSGALSSVIALPKGLGSRPGTESYLWVLMRPHNTDTAPPVRMIDLSRLADAADVPNEFASWQRVFADADPTVLRAVPRLELLDGDTNLLPSRHVVVRSDASAADIARVTSRLEGLYARVGKGLPRFAAPEAPTRHSQVTFGELERVGALTIRARDTTPRAGDVLLRTLGRPPVVATGTQDDDKGIAQVIEVDPARLDPHFVATFLETDANSLPVANTLGALSRDDLRRCRIPRMPIAEQRRYGTAFRQLHELRNTLAALAKVSATVIDQTIHGLTTGALAPDVLVQNDIDKTDPTEGEM